MEALTSTLPNLMNSLEEGKLLGPVIVFCDDMNTTIGLTHQTAEECKNDDDETSTFTEESDEQDQPPSKKRKVEESEENKKKQCLKLVNELQNLAQYPDDHMDTFYGVQSLMVKVGKTILDVNSLSYEDWKEIAEPAPYGDLVANKTVYNETVRKALQIKDFSIESFKVEKSEASTFEEAMIPFLKKDNGVFPRATNIRLVPHAINVYGEGGHFARHVDTQRYPDMIGTLNLIMGTYKGGKFTVFHPTETAVRKNRLIIGSNRDGAIQCVFLRATCPHQVDPVESGVRVSITFDVCGTMNYYGEKSKELLTVVDGVLACHPDKTHVGITMQHMYTAQDIERRQFRSAYDHGLVEAAGTRGTLVSLVWKLNLEWDIYDEPNRVHSNAVSTLNEQDAVTYKNALFFSGKGDELGFRAKYEHQQSAENTGNESMSGNTNATYLVTLLMIARSS